jgi:raffinose/stachyose/melibiose transport system substrate-binding protein
VLGTATILALGLALASTGVVAQDRTRVTVLGTLKSEIASQFEAAVADYNASQDQYEVVTVPLDTDPLEKMSALYASGNAPTLMGMGQEFPRFQDRLLDLTDAEFSAHALPGTQDPVTVDGRIYGMPLTVEAFGLLYNGAVLDEATGSDFDPDSIDSRSALVELMDQVAAIDGKSAVTVSPMDWSLGAHLTNPMFAAQSDDRAERLAFMDALKAGGVSLLGNDVFTGWLDTVDQLLTYNENAPSPLASDYDQGVLSLGAGDVGLWFMGNWALPNLTEVDPEAEFGILPLPVGDDPTAFGNTQVSVGVPFYMVVDASQSTEDEQAGAIDFLNWLVADEVGQTYYVDEFKFLPVFDTIAAQPTDALSQQILDYAAQGRTLEWMNSLYPPDGWPTMGVSMQKYLAGEVDRAGLAAEFEDYWSSIED